MVAAGARRLATPAVVILGAWLVAGIFFGWRFNVFMLVSGQLLLADRILSTVALIVLWTVFTPLVFRIANRFPLRPPKRLRNALVLFAMALGFAAGRAVLDLAVLSFIQQRRQPGSFLHEALVLFHGELLFTIILIAFANYLRIEREDAELSIAETRLEAELAQARLRQLRADLNPHFLFNALNCVAALVNTDPAAAEIAVRKLTDLLRASVASQDRRVIPLAEELEFISRYFDIQKMRFGRKLTTSIRLAESDLGNAAVPPLLLQPLVENSIVHGIGRRRDGGHVAVEVDAIDDCLRMQVRDDGPGCEPEMIFRRGSIGVPNARARLESIYGERYSFTYVRSGEEFVAEIRIPLRIEEVA